MPEASGKPQKISLSINEMNRGKQAPARASQKPVEKPKSLKEVAAEKEKDRIREQNRITITNISKQLIKIHQDAPKGVDFYIGAEDKDLFPGRTYTFKKHRLRMPQIERLQKMGKIQVISDTEKSQEEDTSKKVTIIK